MRTNQKFLLPVFLVVLMVMAVGGAAVVAAQETLLPMDATETQINDDDGAGETPASSSDAALTEAEAVAIAEAERGSTATFVELEREGGIVAYSIELKDGSEVEIDANTGDILEIENAGSDDD